MCRSNVFWRCRDRCESLYDQKRGPKLASHFIPLPSILWTTYRPAGKERSAPTLSPTRVFTCVISSCSSLASLIAVLGRYDTQRRFARVCDAHAMFTHGCGVALQNTLLSAKSGCHILILTFLFFPHPLRFRIKFCGRHIPGLACILRRPILGLRARSGAFCTSWRAHTAAADTHAPAHHMMSDENLIAPLFHSGSLRLSGQKKFTAH